MTNKTNSRTTISIKALEIIGDVANKHLQNFLTSFHDTKNDDRIQFKAIELNRYLLENGWDIDNIEYSDNYNAVVNVFQISNKIVRIDGQLKVILEDGILRIIDGKVTQTKRIRKIV